MFKMGQVKDEKEAKHEITSLRSNPEATAPPSNQSLEEVIKKARENFTALEAIKDSENNQTKW